MPKIEVPLSVTFCVQWTLHPFATPQIAEQKSANSKWALAKTKELLESNSIGHDEVRIASKYNGMVSLEIVNPCLKEDNGNEQWAIILNALKKSNDVETISVFVNNDKSEMIACKFADYVQRPWHQGYHGYNKTTLIYHK